MASPSRSSEYYEISPDCSREEFLAVCRIYARDIGNEHDLAVDVNNLGWKVSMRAKRRAGVVYHKDGQPTSVKLTWEFFEEEGWAGVAETIRHELIHVHLLNENDDPGHGEDFQRLADELDTQVHCDRFADPKWWVECEDCGRQLARYRRSKLVKAPSEYRCGACGGAFTVTRNK